MSLFGALSAGVAGLLVQGESMGVISDNLANVNTIGYKTNRALFKQLVTSSGISGTRFNAGGVGTDIQRSQKSQGALQSTQSSTDLALSGNGFFTVTDTSSITSETSYFYTRAGAFVENNEGFLVTPSGHYLQGWATDSDGNILNVQDVQSVELQSVSSSAAPSTELNIGANLTSTELIHNYDTSGTLAADIAAVVATPTTADFVTDARLFDSQGAARDVSLAFTKRANNFWDWTMYTDGSNIVGGTTGTNIGVGSGTVRFNANGSLKLATGTSITADWEGGVADGSVVINFGDYTGGYVFDALPAGLQFTDHVLDLSVDENNANAPATILGNYDISSLGGNVLQLQEPDGSLFTATVPGTATNRSVEFANGVTITVSPLWVDPGAGPIATATISGLTAPLDLGRGTDGFVQFASAYNTSFVTQDGFGSGTLSAVSVDEEGFVIGNFTNGEAKKLWKLAVSVFQDPAAMETVSNNLLRETDGSGRPLYKEAGVGGTASVVSGSLESSTVDISGEFSKMIVSQRAFQASSSIITTADQMLNELLQIR
jgi:flagellar hook protein FlgE